MRETINCTIHALKIELSYVFMITTQSFQCKHFLIVSYYQKVSNIPHRMPKVECRRMKGENT